MIHSIELRNFKCFEHQDVVCRPLTLLTGLNGAGKSSVLQSLLLLRQSFQQSLLPDKGLALNGNLVEIGTARDALYENAAADAIEFSLDFGDSVRSVWRFLYSRAADVLTLDHNLFDRAAYDHPLFGDAFHYLHAERLGPRTSFAFSEYDTRQHRQLGPRGEFAPYFLYSFGQEPIPCEKLRHKDAISPSLRDQVEAWIAPICPGIRLSLSAVPGMDLVGLEYSIQSDRNVSNTYRSTNVGFGITYALPILVAVLSSAPGALILMENPGAHLHPRGQSAMGQLLSRAANCGIQILVETHSDHVLNGIRLAVHDGELSPDDVQLHFFSRNSNGAAGVVSPRIDQDGRIDPWPEDFFDEWDRSLEGLLAPRSTSTA
jgi:predicted ATPase